MNLKDQRLCRGRENNICKGTELKKQDILKGPRMIEKQNWGKEHVDWRGRKKWII